MKHPRYEKPRRGFALTETAWEVLFLITCAAILGLTLAYAWFEAAARGWI